MPVHPLHHIGEADRTHGLLLHPDPPVRGSKVLRLGGQHAGRHDVDPLSQHPRGLEDSRPADDDAPRAVVAETPGTGLRVSLHHAHKIDFATERVRRYLRQGGLVPVARGRDSGQHHHLPGGHHPHGGSVVPVVRDASGHGHALGSQLLTDAEAYVPALRPGGRLHAGELRVADRLQHLVERLLVCPAVEHRAGGLRVGEGIAGDEVAAPDIRTRDSEAPRHLLHDAVHQERRDVLPEASVGRPGAFVGHDAGEPDPHVLDLVHGG